MASNAERQAAYRARKRDDGLVQVQVFVPPGRQRDIRRAAARMASAARDASAKGWST